MSVPKRLRREELRKPYQAFIVWDMVRGDVISSGLVLGETEADMPFIGPLTLLTKTGATESINVDSEWFGNPCLLVLDGNYYHANPEELAELPRIPDV